AVLARAGGAATFFAAAPARGAGVLRAAAAGVLVLLRLADRLAATVAVRVARGGVEGFLAAVFFAGLIAFFATVLGLRCTAHRAAATAARQDGRSGFDCVRQRSLAGGLKASC